MYYITAVSVWDGLEKVVFRSKNLETITARFNKMRARGSDVKLTEEKPKRPKMCLQVSVLSYND